MSNFLLWLSTGPVSYTHLSELVGTRDTYVKETRKVYQRRKNGQYKFGTDADYMEYEVDVPATEYFYDVTYQCSKCGHKEIQRESKVQKN